MVFLMFYSFLFQFVMVAVAFSAPAGSNTNGRPSQGFEPPSGNNQVQGAGQSNKNEQFRGPVGTQHFQGFTASSNNQVQGADQRDKNEQFREPVDSHPVQGFESPSHNNQVQGAGQSNKNEQSRGPVDSHPVQGFESPSRNNQVQGADQRDKFNFHTGMPFTGAHGHGEDATHQPMFFRRQNVRNEHA
jgi:hypothetical protein